MIERRKHESVSKDVPEVRCSRFTRRNEFTKAAAELSGALDRWCYFVRHGAELDLDHLPATLDVPESDLVDRILHRAAIEGRADDTRDAIAERMHEYHKLTHAVLDHYRKQGVRVEVVDGMGDVDEVFGRIRRAIGISSR